MTDQSMPVWFGFLEAGPRSSPVARDEALDTGSPDKIYLFNLHRGTFLEYRRDIVEAKLRDLGADEADLVEALREAFEEARKSFTPRRRHRSSGAARQRVRAAQRTPGNADDEEETDDEIPQIPDDWGEGADDDGDDDSGTDDVDEEDDED
jgi:hypothetical protein